jgi:hypothetical protein
MTKIVAVDVLTGMILQLRSWPQTEAAGLLPRMRHTSSSLGGALARPGPGSPMTEYRAQPWSRPATPRRFFGVRRRSTPDLARRLEELTGDDE